MSDSEQAEREAPVFEPGQHPDDGVVSMPTDEEFDFDDGEVSEPDGLDEIDVEALDTPVLDEVL